MVKKIDGQAIALRVREKIAREIAKYNGTRPNLAIILVGEREDSKIYASLKEKLGRTTGIDTHLYKLDADTPESELLKTIKFLNEDQLIDGILVQLPLPDNFDTDKVINALDPKKDCDGFHPEHPNYIVSPVLAAVKACLEEINFIAQGKKVSLLYNSDIFGQGLKKLLTDEGAMIVSKEKKAEADLIISALGQPQSLKKEDIKSGAVLIDIGITKVDGQVLGDFDFADIKNKAAYITPVPGGIGPLTIAFLFNNVLEIFKRRYN